MRIGYLPNLNEVSLATRNTEKIVKQRKLFIFQRNDFATLL